MDAIAKWSTMPFDYDGHDCCAFVGECLQELNGVNPMRALSYSGEREAMRIIQHHGGLDAAITHVLGVHPHDKEPLTGDVATVMSSGRLIAGIVYVDRIVMHSCDTVVDVGLERGVNFWRP